MSQRVRLLDATLRDGSYCIDFQFTAADTAVIVGLLDAAGVGFIELGHGSGTFNHKAPPQFQSPIRQAEADERYFAVARACASRAKLGVITGPFGLDSLHVIAEHRLDFVRMAVMADRALEPQNLKMAERSKALGLLFSVNLMQTTAITPARLAEVAVEYQKAGTDWFYVVDSSGGLLPHAVTEYVARVRDSGMTIGYHAHHNSGLAIANCLAAIDAGAVMVDGTLQGLGRDVGNAPTEQLLFMLQRLGHEREIDVEHLCHAGDLIRGLLLDKGNDPTYFASGVSEIHSTNVERLVELAREKGVGARSLLAAVALGKTKLIGASMKTFPDEILLPALARATKVTDAKPRAEVIDVLGEEITRASSVSVPVVADVVFARASKWHKTSVLHLVPHELFPFDGPLPWAVDALCGVTLGVTRGELGEIEVGDRQPDVLVIDPALSGQTLPRAKASCVDAFLPVIIESALTLATLCAQDRARVYLACASPITARPLAARADQLGEHARVVGPEGDWLGAVKPGDAVIVVGHREVPPAIAALASRGVRVLRPAIATTIATRIAALLEIRARLERGCEGPLVDPIFVPTAGQVIVDDPQCPSTLVNGGGKEGARSAAVVRARTLSTGRGRL